MTRSDQSIPKRIMILALVALGICSMTNAARAQTYDPNYPVCLQVFGLINYYDCRYASIQQCAVSQSARAAQCIVNPFYRATKPNMPTRRHQRRRAE